MWPGVLCVLLGRADVNGWYIADSRDSHEVIVLQQKAGGPKVHERIGRMSILYWTEVLKVPYFFYVAWKIAYRV
jgi:hypothetical protein